MAPLKHEGVQIQECVNCRDCCKNLAETICGFNTIEAIQDGTISEEDARMFIVIRVKESQIDESAKHWGIYPVVNLVKYMTSPSNGFYDLLATPPSKEDCVFLTGKGCKYPSAKSFECGLYPFYMYKLKLRTDYHCDFAWDLDNDTGIREVVGQYFSEYLLYSNEHKEQYFKTLPLLKERYALKIIDYTVFMHIDVLENSRLQAVS
ncbi:MAG: hypothetical protein ACFFCS_22075 [Candidatus Hodarchaeota archaeon]